MVISSALSVLFLSACAPPEESGGPLADAGANRRGTLDDVYFFDASDSMGDSLTYSWQFVEKPLDTRLTDNDIEGWNTPYAVLEPDVLGDYEMEVTVCDDMGLCDTAIAVAFVQELDAYSGVAPTASCSFDAAITTGASTTLDCSASSDPEGDPLTYIFSFYSLPAGSALAGWELTGRYTDTASYVPDQAGDYSVRFRVIDDTPNSDRIFLEQTSSGAGNTAPAASAGADQSVALGPIVTLDGTGSTDADADPLTYRWSFKTIPAKSGLVNGNIRDRTTDTANFTPAVAGTYEIRLRADDGTTTGVDFATITVSGSPTIADLVAGDLVITEVMKNPIGSDGDGEWFEIYNDSGFDVDINGLELVGRTDSTTLSSSYTVGDGDFAVIGANSDTGTNGGVGVDATVTYSSFFLANGGDDISLEVSGNVIDVISYTEAAYPNVEGENWNLPNSLHDATSNNNSNNWCRSYRQHGPDDNYGTPGWGNNDCLTAVDDVQPIIDSNCSGCHTGGGSSGNLTLDDVYASTVGVASDDLPKMNLVAADDTANSYLWHKINGTQGDVGGAGNQMPNGGPYLSSTDLETIENWINGGAVE